MTNGTGRGAPSLADSLSGGIQPGDDLGPTGRDAEIAYRRGYSHAVADVVDAVRNGARTADEIMEWLEGELREWRFREPLDRKVVPPQC